METSGELECICILEEREIEWKVLNFSQLFCENGSKYESPNFYFANESFCLRMYPNGDRKSTAGYVSLFLMKSSGLSVKIEFSLCLKSINGKKDPMYHFAYIFKEAEGGYGLPKYISRLQLERKTDLLPDDVITIFCNLKYSVLSETTTTTNCSSCKETLGAESVSLYKKRIEKTVKCPKCSDIVALQKWLHGHKCQTENRIEADGSLCQDFKNMLLGGINHDLILKINEREFRAHRDVLRARSRVFKSMLTHDMVEKNSGIIDVADCDPQAMEQFLYYIYSGKVQLLDQNNMIGLYYISDKYEMKVLKEECSNFIKQSLSPNNFCDVIQLALNHSDLSLQEFATEFFINNVLDILRTVEWQIFMKDNLTVANELIIKSHEKKK